MMLAASQLCRGWQTDEATKHGNLPVLGVPEGPYLEQASKEGLAAFELQLALLEKAGYTVRRVKALEEIDSINRQHSRLVFAEMAKVHADWFARYEALYRPRTAAAIREGQEVSAEELSSLRASPIKVRSELDKLMAEEGIDMWVCPSATGPAPEGISSTGSPLMNLPWTHAGLPAISLPAGYAGRGLPLGLQCACGYMKDEVLLGWSAMVAQVVHTSRDASQ